MPSPPCRVNQAPRSPCSSTEPEPFFTSRLTPPLQSSLNSVGFQPLVAGAARGGGDAITFQVHRDGSGGKAPSRDGEGSIFHPQAVFRVAARKQLQLESTPFAQETFLRGGQV